MLTVVDKYVYNIGIETTPSNEKNKKSKSNSTLCGS